MPVPRRQIHLITPGDHFSPRTGSAIPTVVNGLCRATAPGRHRPAVLVARGTYPDRYDSAQVIEYDPAPSRPSDRWVDAVVGRLGRPRPGASRVLAAALAAQEPWDDAVLLAHNAPQAVPLVAARHRPVLYAHNQLLRTYGRRELGRVLGPAVAIVCVSTYLAGEVAALLPPPLRDRVRVVRNGVDLDHFAGPRTPRTDALRVAFVGRVVPDKGAHVLVETVRRLGRSDIRLTVVGRAGFSATDPLTRYERHLHEDAATLGDRVTFTSFVARPDLPGILRASDVVVVPSVWPEPFALTVLEGMAAGAAVVASTAGGITEQLGDAGIPVPPGDVDALAGVLEHLADDPAALTAAQQRCREHAAANTWARATDDLRRVLDDLG